MTDTKSGFARWLSGDIRNETIARLEIEKRQARLGGLLVDDDAQSLTWQNETVPMSAVSASFEQALPTERITATRVVAGAMLAGPAGAIAGALAKKRTSGGGYLLIDAPEAQWLIPVPDRGADEARALPVTIENVKRKASA